MKVFNLLLVTCLLLSISSCQKEEIFSCNKEVNSWVNENLDKVRTMTRSEWKNLDESVKRGCYVAFTQQQKTTFWKEKLNEVLELDWSPEEVEHIRTASQFIETHPAFFDYSREKTDEEIEEFEIFVHEWIKKAEIQLGWHKTLIGSMIATGNRLLDKEGTIQINETRAMTKSGGESNCNCSTSADYCSSSDCTSGGCSDSSHGCGHFFVYSCDGRCNGI